ncbi:alpha/beta hydrolase fold domain-containing protein [bacterium AH-315-O15]|nr:alpha/beta hydrolase fold domain-containing protein [bacterium AH-315-O15]
MKGTTRLLSCILPIALIGIGISATASAESAFLKSAHELNGEFRGFCLDVPGHTPDINLDGPLRLHSCKYGEDATDQEWEWLGNGQILAAPFDRCLAAEELTTHGTLYIKECAEVPEQIWTISDTGNVSPASRADLCITIEDEYRLAGTPPWISPVYYAREVDLQVCADHDATLTEFRWGELEELERSNADTLGDHMPPDLTAAIREIVSRGAGAQETSALYRDQPRVYEMGEIEVAENIAYGPHERHRLDIHTDNYRYGDIPMPVVMYFHGGGFVRGNRAGSRNVSDYFASVGLVGVNATYRLAEDAQWPAGSQDVAAAVAWVRDNIGDYGGDPNQIFVVGKSAGAFHVAEYALRPEIAGDEGSAPAGVVLISGTYGADTNNPADGRVAYFGDDLSRWPDIAILGNIRRTNVPLLLSISDYDSQGTKASFANLVHELTAGYARMPRVVQLVGHDHYSPNPSIGTQDTQLSREILQLIRSAQGVHQPITAR